MKLKSLSAVMTAGALALTMTPSSRANSAPIYMEPVASSATLTALATAGDSIGGYLLPGILDGIGVRKNGNALQVLVNHEISPLASSTARVGGTVLGATVSSLTVDPVSMKVTAAKEAIAKITWFDYASGKYGATPGSPVGAPTEDAYKTPNHAKALNRFCSASLSADGELLYKAGNKSYGYAGAVYFTGEEGGDESRAFALNMAGELVQLPRLGLAAWENVIPVPTKNQTTALMVNEDGSATDSQQFMYIGKKMLIDPKSKKKPTWYESAGLTNGKYYVMKIGDFKIESEFRTSVGKGVPTPVSFKEIDTNVNGKVQNQLAAMLGTSLARVEDGAFDPKNPNDYYFVTTESNKDAKATAANPATPTVKRDGGALWRVRFNDVRNPLAGAQITMLLDGSEAPYLNKPDNITVDSLGNVLIQEDPGNNDQLARLLAYRIADGKIGVVARFKATYFDKANTATFMTADEESSGVVEATSVMRSGSGDSASYYLLDAQVHAKTSVARPDITDAAAKASVDSAAVEGGQLYVLKISDWSKVYSG